MLNGQVKNYSSKILWVLESGGGKFTAHKLAPNQQSPADIDADGFCTVDGTPIDGHQQWVKIVDIATAEVKDNGEQLTGGYLFGGAVEDEFSNVQFDESDGWGEQII